MFNFFKMFLFLDVNNFSNVKFFLECYIFVKFFHLDVTFFRWNVGFLSVF